jgi:hypothetical protein
METDTVVDASALLKALRAELVTRALEAQLQSSGRRPALKIVNPAAPGLRATVVVDGVNYIWDWGVVISPVVDLTTAAEKITHALRAVGGSPDDDFPPPSSDIEAPHDVE